VNRWFLLPVLVIALIATGCTDQRQSDWANREGDDWEAFADAYDKGWDAGCTIAFEDSPDGYLYDQGERFSADDCQGRSYAWSGDMDLVYNVPEKYPSDPAAAGNGLGLRDGCEYAFERLPPDEGGRLYYGDTYYDASLCPGGDPEPVK